MTAHELQAARVLAQIERIRALLRTWDAQRVDIARKETTGGN